jgi:hypothetical protein
MRKKNKKRHFFGDLSAQMTLDAKDFTNVNPM